jgi:hypothetical protein
MTAAQILRAEGRAEGEAKGRAEGEAKGRAEVLLKLLEKKFGSVGPEIRDRVVSATIQDLDRWVERVLSAATLEEVLSD